MRASIGRAVRGKRERHGGRTREKRRGRKTFDAFPPGTQSTNGSGEKKQRSIVAGGMRRQRISPPLKGKERKGSSSWKKNANADTCPLSWGSTSYSIKGKRGRKVWKRTIYSQRIGIIA